jgi:lysophospholipase L1-like esterase
MTAPSLLLRRIVLFLASSSCLLVLLDESNYGQATQQKPRNHEQWAKDIARFEASDRLKHPPTNAILFAGSSTMVYWNTAKSFPELATINRGFGGSHLSDSLYFAQRIIVNYQPKTVVVYAGDNDLADGISPEQIRQDFLDLVKIIHKALPKTRILYLAIKPCPKRWALFDTQKMANQIIEEVCKKDEQLQYVDTVKPMLDESGKPRKDLYRADGLHLSDKGYEMWTSILKPLLAK